MALAKPLLHRYADVYLYPLQLFCFVLFFWSDRVVYERQRQQRPWHWKRCTQGSDAFLPPPPPPAHAPPRTCAVHPPPPPPPDRLRNELPANQQHVFRCDRRLASTECLHMLCTPLESSSGHRSSHCSLLSTDPPSTCNSATIRATDLSFAVRPSVHPPPIASRMLANSYCWRRSTPPTTHASQFNSPGTNPQRNPPPKLTALSRTSCWFPLRFRLVRWAVHGMDRIAISVQPSTTRGSGCRGYPTANMPAAARSVSFLSFLFPLSNLALARGAVLDPGCCLPRLEIDPSSAAAPRDCCLGAPHVGLVSSPPRA